MTSVLIQFAGRTFTYTKESLKLKGTRIPGSGDGQITLFDREGSWNWEKKECWSIEDVNDGWNKMMRGNGGYVWSCPVLLPSERGDLCIYFRIQNHDVQKMKVDFCCYSFPHNKAREKNLPIDLQFIFQVIERNGKSTERKCFCRCEKWGYLSSVSLIDIDPTWDKNIFPNIQISLD